MWPIDYLGDKLTLLKRAGDRRRAFKDAGLQPFELMFTTSGNTQGILCLCCGLSSANPNDVANTYCFFCGVFHGDPM